MNYCNCFPTVLCVPIPCAYLSFVNTCRDQWETSECLPQLRVCVYLFFVNACRGQWQTLEYLHYSPLYYLKQESLSEPGVHHFSYPGWSVSLCDPTISAHSVEEVTHVHTMADLYMSARYARLGP